MSDWMDYIKRWEVDLTPRERDIVKLRYGLDGGPERTLFSISLVYGVTKSRVRQIEAKAIRKMRHGTRIIGAVESLKRSGFDNELPR